MSHLPFSQLQQLANDLEPPGSHPPKVWFEKARHEADKAILAERVGKQEEMFVAYVRACQSYTNVKNHPNYAEERKKDMAWAGRVKDFKEVSLG
jgi:ubiquitin carboxyl-terminal hydrolase 8